jgi:hypothetical protein
MAVTIVEAARDVTGGIDTHGEVHVAAALDEVGGLLGTQSFRATSDGYSALLSWLAGFGAVQKVGVEGTGSFEGVLTRRARTPRNWPPGSKRIRSGTLNNSLLNQPRPPPCCPPSPFPVRRPWCPLR